MEKIKNNKGITLIALVITIIVLLILAAVSIATLTGQNGILTQADNAKTQAGIGEEKEAIGLAYNGAKTEKLGGEITADDLNSQFTKNGVNATASGTGKIKVAVPDTGRNYKIDNNVISDNINTITFENNNKCIVNNKEYLMRGNLLTKNNQKYISISDIEYLFNLTAVFDFDSKEISFLNKLPELKINENIESASGKAALLRLEDFSAGYGTLNSENQLKYKCIGNLLKSNNLKFHIAWVPRFKCPSEDIDNNLLENKSLENIGYINVLDYFINSGGKIGLHGYSHQAGNNTSLNGVELSITDNNSEEDTREVIISAIDTAAYLNIPYDFFESPHYRASLKQKDIIKEYFQFIYEPRNIFIYNKIYKHNNNLYIPTPLGYVENSDTSNIEKYLKSPRPNQLSSLFYHPAIELEYINFKITNNDITLDYNNSPLYRIIYCLKENDYIAIYITDLKK